MKKHIAIIAMVVVLVGTLAIPVFAQTGSSHGAVTVDLKDGNENVVGSATLFTSNCRITVLVRLVDAMPDDPLTVEDEGAYGVHLRFPCAATLPVDPFTVNRNGRGTTIERFPNLPCSDCGDETLDVKVRVTNVMGALYTSGDTYIAVPVNCKCEMQ